MEETGAHSNTTKQQSQSCFSILNIPRTKASTTLAGIAACATSPMSLTCLLAETEVKEHPLPLTDPRDSWCALNPQLTLAAPLHLPDYPLPATTLKPVPGLCLFFATSRRFVLLVC